MILDVGVVHADPHPGNFIARMPGTEKDGEEKRNAWL